MRALAAYRGVLAIREARALIGASAASQVGDWLYNAALLGYVFGATHSAVWVGAATICRLLPYVLFGTVRRRHRRSVSAPHGLGPGKRSTPGAHAGLGGGGGRRWSDRARPRDRRGVVGGRERRAARSTCTAAAARGGGANRSRECLAPHRAGPRRRDWPGDRRVDLRGLICVDRLHRQRRDVRRRRAALRDPRPAKVSRRHGWEPRGTRGRRRRAAHGSRHTLRRAVVRPRRDGRVHVWRTDRAARHLCRQVPEPGHRRLRDPVGSVRRRRARQCSRQRAARDSPKADARRRGRNGARLRQPARVRGPRIARPRAPRHRDRWCRHRLL